MDEFTFSQDTLEVHAGQSVKFVFHNAGLIAHEFRLSNAHRIEEHIASGHEDHDEGGEGGHHEEYADLFILLDAGETGRARGDVPRGHHHLREHRLPDPRSLRSGHGRRAPVLRRLNHFSRPSS